MEEDPKKLWRMALDSLKISISPATFSTWFSRTFVSSIKVGEGARLFVEVACPSHFVADELEKRYFGLIQDALGSLLDKKIDLAFVVKQGQAAQVVDNPSPLFSTSDREEEKKDLLHQALRRARLRAGFTFENFAVSATNQMAHAAADAVSKNPGRAYNPLFLWGGVGVGKTHLMLAIGHRVLSLAPDAPVLYCTAEEFTTEIVEAIRTKTTQEFKNHYRKLALLLVDDVQFLAGKKTIQEEFFHTFNALEKDGKQIVLTSDRPPSEIKELEERLKNRFEAGLIIDISPPDFELRAAISLIKAQERGIDLSMEVAQAIAANIDSPRRIEGFLTRLVSEATAKNEGVSVDLVTRLLGKTNGAPIASRTILPQDFIRAVSDHFAIKKTSLLGAKRSRPIVVPRQILMYLLRVELGLPLQEVGRIVGGRDHTTVMHAVEKISGELSKNNAFRNDVLEIKRLLSG